MPPGLECGHWVVKLQRFRVLGFKMGFARVQGVCVWLRMCQLPIRKEAFASASWSYAALVLSCDVAIHLPEHAGVHECEVRVQRAFDSPRSKLSSQDFSVAATLNPKP